MFRNGELECTIYDEEDRPRVVTVGYLYEPGCPERRYGHPDDWHGAEGAEVDILSVVEGGLVMERRARDQFLEDYGEQVTQKIIEAEEQEYEPDYDPE